MNTRYSSWHPWVLHSALILALGLLAPNGSATGEDSPQVSNAESPRKLEPSPSQGTSHVAAPPSALPVYVPPRRGQPRARVGGAVRGVNKELPMLRALVPDHVALTIQSQPVLFWELDGLPPEAVPVMFSLTSENDIDPLIMATLERPTKAGIQRIDLASFDVELKTGQEYQWAVALVPDVEKRSQDRVTLGWIQRIDGSEVAVGDAAHADAATLAAAGLWYDAIDVAEAGEREALLDQVGVGPASLH